MNDYSKKIHSKIIEFSRKNWDTMDLLTEDDVRCKLYNELDGIKNNEASWHSEVRWYGDDRGGRLKYRSDLVCVHKEDLRTRNGQFKLPSKGYAFDKFYALIEIKLRRPNGDSDLAWKEKITADLRKNKNIQGRVDNCLNPIFLVLALDKKSDISNSLPSTDDLIYKFIS
jgi:hypothetical protein